MNEQGNDLPWDIRALLESERAVQPLAPAVRARAVGRARAAMVVGEIAVLRGQTDVTLGGRALAACVSVAAALAIATGTYQLRAHLGERAMAASARPLNPRPATPSAPAEAATASQAGRLGRQPIRQEPWEGSLDLPRRLRWAKPSSVNALFPPSRQESHLLRVARSAMARQDFASALLALAEHARRFHDGSLAEEREVLRLRALVGLVLTTR